MVVEYWESKLIAKRGHLKYLEELRELSRSNRKKYTKSEKILWDEVLRSRKTGFKFLRQKPIYKFILDFYCRELLMVIEIDGGYHQKRKYVDLERDLFLKGLNIETLRIEASDVEERIEFVKQLILENIKQRKVSLFKGNSSKR